MKQKLFAMVIATGLVFSLAACGNTAPYVS